MGILTGYQPAQPVNPHDANGISRINPKADRAAAKTAYVTWLANKKNQLYGGGANPGLFDHTGLTYSDETGGFGGEAYYVTVSGGKYFIDGVETPTLDLLYVYNPSVPGSFVNHMFITTDGSVGSHPFRFSTTPDGTHGGGVELVNVQYSIGSGYTNLFSKPVLPSILYYYCSSHPGMGGKLTLS
tara:strand:+ start:2769 stop:3323 length:555 start_codon:yes stop_codon:yes gene_type:complete